MKKISVIIPCYNDPAGLEATLNSLERQSLPRNLFEIIVGNDGASKDVKGVCAFFGVICVDIKPRKGVSVARNSAIAKSSCDLLAFVDSDILCDKYWLEKGLRLLEKYDYIGGRVKISVDNNRIHEYYRYLTAFNNKHDIKNNNFFGGANIFLNKKIILDLGGFDERFIFGSEDREFGQRIFLSNKYKIFYADDVIVNYPTLSFKEILGKNDIYRESTFFMASLFPERFPKIKPSFLKLLKIILNPPIKVLFSEREINRFIKVKVFFWSFYFGFLDSLSYIKNRIKNKQYYDFFK